MEQTPSFINQIIKASFLPVTIPDLLYGRFGLQSSGLDQLVCVGRRGGTRGKFVNILMKFINILMKFVKLLILQLGSEDVLRKKLLKK